MPPDRGERRVTLGRVAGIFGIKGWLRIQSYTRPVENIFEYAPWLLGAERCQIEEARAHGPGFVVKLAGIEDRDQAAALLGVPVEVPRSALPEPEDGQVYWADLIGLDVFCEDGRPLGQVETLMENGAQDVLVIRGEDREHLVPFVRGPIVKAVEAQDGRIVVDWSPDY